MRASNPFNLIKQFQVSFFFFFFSIFPIFFLFSFFFWFYLSQNFSTLKLQPQSGLFVSFGENLWSEELGDGPRMCEEWSGFGGIDVC
jgi:hypothetical protein